MRSCAARIGLAAALSWFALGPRASGQTAERVELNTDRDAFTPSAFCVDPGRLLTEFSYVYIQNREGKPTNSYPELLCRIAATDRFEWRFGVNYSVGSQGNVVTSVEAGELNENGQTIYESSVLYGFKASVSDQQGWLPQTCFIMEADTPMYGEQFGTAPIATAVAGWELPVAFPGAEGGQWRLDGAVRYSYVEGLDSWFNRWGPSAVLRMPVTERFEVHAEWFGTFSNGLPVEKSRTFFSPGMHVVLTQRFELGLRVGWGLTQDAANFFSDAGCAWRF